MSTSSSQESFVLLRGPPAVLAHLEHLDLSAHVEFKETRVISAGAFADVTKQRCILPERGMTRVAIKRLRIYTGEDISKLLEKEIHVRKKLKHKNILPLLGFAFDDRTGYPLLVSEWMENGPALEYVRKHCECDLIHFVAGIAEGLDYLHKKEVVHSDIKPNNILVSPEGAPLIVDFGCARLIEASMSLAKLSSTWKGTTRYLAYELLKEDEGNTGYSKKSDVWAFGITVYELFSLQRAYHTLREEQVAIAILELRLPSRPEPCSWNILEPEEQELLWNICQICWTPDALARPGMETMLDMLEKSKELRKTAHTEGVSSNLNATSDIVDLSQISSSAGVTAAVNVSSSASSAAVSTGDEDRASRKRTSWALPTWLFAWPRLLPASSTDTQT